MTLLRIPHHSEEWIQIEDFQMMGCDEYIYETLNLMASVCKVRNSCLWMQ